MESQNTSTKFPDAILFAILLSILIGMELLAAWVAFYTLGATYHQYFYLLISFNVAALLLFEVNRKFTAVLFALLLALVIIPVQLYWGYRFLHIQEEAKNVVNYVYSYRLEHHQFPEDLSEYPEKYPDLKKFVVFRPEPDDFVVSFYVRHRKASHYYRHSGGVHWKYSQE
jgi:predicted membrane protein